MGASKTISPTLVRPVEASPMHPNSTGFVSVGEKIGGEPDGIY